MKSIPTLALAAALSLYGGAAFAQDKPVAKPAAKPVATKAAPVVGRDWTKIDTNKDNYISPEEMEVWLKANGPDSK